MRRDRVAVRVGEAELAAEGAGGRRLDDRHAGGDEVVVERVGVVAGEPEGDAPAEVRGRGQVHHRLPDRERDRGGLEDDGVRRTGRVDLQSHRLGVEPRAGGEIAHLQRDEVGTDELGHGDVLSCYARISTLI